MHVLFPKKLSFLLVQRISGWLRESDLKPEVYMVASIGIVLRYIRNTIDIQILF